MEEEEQSLHAPRDCNSTIIIIIFVVVLNVQCHVSSIQ